MPRIAPLPRSKFGPTARITDRVIRRMVGGSIEGTGIYARTPALLRATGGMERYFLGRRRAVPHRTFELVALRAAMEVGCSFCIDMGSYMAGAKHGVSAEQLRALDDPAGSGLFEPAEVVALELAARMTATPPAVDDALWARVREHYDEEQQLELVTMIGWENFRARTNAALEVESHGFAPVGACAVATRHASAGEPLTAPIS
ncbi:MAG: carboxymuconolactone decarboxylase family protein [Patulibacter minatonensis]